MPIYFTRLITAINGRAGGRGALQVDQVPTLGAIHGTQAHRLQSHRGAQSLQAPPFESCPLWNQACLIGPVVTVTDALIGQYYPSDHHPYRILENEGMRYVGPDCVLLDAGCGHTAPLLLNLAPHVARAIGVDVCEPRPAGIEYIHADLAHTGLPPGSVDLVISRSVLEHLSAPLDVFREIHRILRPSGRFVFLTPNRWDYASLAALAIPNRLHPRLVRRLTDRKECDTFPTFYRANTNRAIRRLARQSGFTVESLRYLNQYPDYFRKLPPLFLLGIAYERLTSAWDRLGFLRGWILGTLLK